MTTTPNTNHSHVDAGDYYCNCADLVEMQDGVCARCCRYIAPSVNKEIHIYTIEFYALSDCQATAIIDAVDDRDALIQLRQRYHGIDYIISMSAKPKPTKTTATHCGACGQSHQDCDCIPF